MIDIINNILCSNGYVRVDIDMSLDDHDIHLFCPAKDSRREEYFVTLQMLEQSDATAQAILHEKAQYLFETIRDSGKVDRPFEKNCTMLICHEESKISRKTILTIEEDQYDFKKNVIAYSARELESLRHHLLENGIEKLTNSTINEIVNSDNGRGFLAFKDNHKDSNGCYSLILKTVLKLPFVTYSPQEQQLINLSFEIEKSLTQYQSSIYNQLVESDVVWTEENIHQQVERIWGGLV